MIRQNEETHVTIKPISYHWKELYQRSFYVILGFMTIFCVAYIYGESLLYLISKPFLELDKRSLLETGLPQDFLFEGTKQIGNAEFIYTSVTEAFLSRILITFWTALILTIPIFSYHVYSFLRPGLYWNEIRTLKFGLLVSLGLLLLSFLITNFLILPFALKFFALDFTQTTSSAVSATTPTTTNSLFALVFQPKIEAYLAFVLKVFTYLALSFQFPLVIFLLNTANILPLSVLTRRKTRKILCVLAFCIGAIISPPDILSQFIVSIPLIFLFEITVIFLLVGSLKKN